MSCGNSQVQKLVSDMTSTYQHLLMSANICQRLPAPIAGAHMLLISHVLSWSSG